MISHDDIIFHCKRKGKLMADRGTWETHWQDLANYVLPNSADFSVKRAKGDKRTTLLYDSTGVHSNEMLAAGLHGMLTNPASQWFGLRVRGADETRIDPESKNWLEASEKAMISELSAPEVAFPSHIHEFYLSLCSIGTAVLFIGESVTQEGRISFKTIHVEEVCIAENADGVIDTVYRTTKMSLRQIVQRWGEAALSKRMKRVYEKKEYDKEFEILHCVYPRKDVRPGREDKEGLPVASIYIDEKERHVLAEGGFPEMPYMVARWAKATGEVFGRSPAMTALPDIKMLQEMMKTTIKAGQKIVDPPLLVPDDGVLGPVRTIPGGLNYYRSSVGARIEPLLTGGNIPISMEMMEDVRSRVRTTFFLDQLQFQGGPQMTATEVIERTERTLRLLGPTLGRLQSEFLGPMIERIYGVLGRAGRLPPAPEAIADQELKIEYVSPLARAQRQIEAQGLMRTLELAGPIAGMDPNAARILRGGDTMRYVADLYGVPPKLLKSEKELQAEMQQEAQMAQAQQAMAMMQQGADVAQKVGNAGITEG